jgi:CheY-like chemotaxis protein
MKALLAEDNQNERELFAGLLRMAGLEVETAGDGDAVLAYLNQQGCPDVLLLDMRLPHRDGPATLKAIRQEPSYSALKIFAVSGYAPDYFGLDATAAGVDRWFLKPIHPEVMLRELTQALHIQA